MTVVLTAVHPRFGVWQATDRFIRQGDVITNKDWCKQLAVYCLDGCILLAYTGIADAPGHIGTAEWLASVAACGYPETVDQFLTRLLEQLNAAFATGGMYFRELLIVTGTAFVQSGKAYTFAFSNRKTNSSGRSISLRSFAFLPRDLDGQCIINASGDAAGYVPESERRRISEIITHIPRRRNEYLKLLATTIERISSRNARVSPWTQGVFMPRLGYPLLGETFEPSGLREDREVREVPVVHLGLLIPYDTGVARAELAKRNGREVITYRWELSVAPGST